MNVNQLIKTFISYLINTDKIKNQEEMGAIMGYPNKTVFSRKLSSNIDNDFIVRMQTSFPEFDKWTHYIALFEDDENHLPIKTKKEAPFEDLTVDRKLDKLNRLLEQCFIKIEKIEQSIVNKDIAEREKVIEKSTTKIKKEFQDKESVKVNLQHGDTKS